MKKFIAIVLVLIIALGLFACGKEPEDTKATENTSASSTDEPTAEKPSTEPSSETTTKSTVYDPENPQKGTEGKGPTTVKMPSLTLSVPKGMGFSLDTYTINEENPYFSSIFMTIKNSEGKNAGTFCATSIDKFNNQEEAVAKALKNLHLDTYKNAKYTEDKNVKIGNCTFTVLHVSTDYSEKDYYVTFVKRGESDKFGLFIQLEINKKYMEADDPVITEFLKSISVVTEK